MAGSAASSSSGTKRKRGGAQGYYAVKAGHKPGIYYSWADVQEQTNGYSNSKHKKFNTLVEAEAFLKGETVATSKPKQTKYYAVQKGHVPGVYEDYDSAFAQIKGFRGPQHKKFDTRQEAEVFVATGTRGLVVNGLAYAKDEVESEASMSDARNGCKVGDNVAKKRKANDGSVLATLVNGDMEPGAGPLPPDTEDGFDRRIKLNPRTGDLRYKTEDELSARKLQNTGEYDGWIHIYTDGSCLGNGQMGAYAGVGVFFGPRDPRNISEGLPGETQTNNRAEMSAIQRALDSVAIDRKCVIHSDSQYAQNCITKWHIKWRSNNWRTAAGKPVENKDLIEPLLKQLEERALAGGVTKFEWVRGHNNDPGNEAADELAVNGAREAKAFRKKGYGFKRETHAQKMLKEIPTKEDMKDAIKAFREADEEYAAIKAFEDMDEEEIGHVFGTDYA